MFLNNLGTYDKKVLLMLEHQYSLLFAKINLKYGNILYQHILSTASVEKPLCVGSYQN